MNRIRLSLTALILAISAVIAVVLATSGGAATKTQPPIVPSSAISVKQTTLGPTLTDATGHTLYLFEGDRRNLSTLSSAGRAVWPPFSTTAKPRALGGAVASHIGTIAGSDGTDQVTYNGHPLYYYVGDRGPGQTNGQGLNQFGALWYVLGPAGTALTSPQASSAPSSASSSPGYGGY